MGPRFRGDDMDLFAEPVIGFAEGETRWRGMTTDYEAAQCVTARLH
jgi:hypothetical protein